MLCWKMFMKNYPGYVVEIGTGGAVQDIPANVLLTHLCLAPHIYVRE